MKSLLIILLSLPMVTFSQSDYGYLKVIVSFDKYRALNTRIKGTVKIGNNKYFIQQGQSVIVENIGKHEVLLSCWMNALSLKENIAEKRIIDIKPNDTTYVNIGIPDELVRSVNYLPLLDKSGKFFPLVDSLAFLDEEGKRYGLWTSPRSYIGDCINYFGTTYSLYDGGKIILEIEEICDMNFCYENENPYSISFTRNNADKTFQLTTFPEYNVCETINDSIYFRIGQNIESHKPNLADIIQFFRDNIRKDFHAPFIFGGKKLGGEYLIFESDRLKDTVRIE